MKEQGYFSVVMYKDCDMKSFVSRFHLVTDVLNHFVENYEVIAILGEELSHEDMSRLDEVKNQAQGHVILVTLSKCHSRACGILAGIDLAIGDYIYEIESNVTDDCYTLLPAMYRELTEYGYDAVCLHPRSKGIIGAVATKMLKGIGKPSIVLGGNSIRLVTRRGINVLDQYRETENTRNLMYQLSGLKIKHIYVKEEQVRKRGNLTKEIGYFLRMKKVGSRCAYLLAGIYSVILIGLMVMGRVDSSYVMPLFMLSFPILLILLGMLMNYLLLVYGETKNNVSYTVQEVRRLK